MEKLNLDPTALDRLREGAPLVHHLTNTVTVNDCANITLAIGGSPAMTEEVVDGEDLVQYAGALVLNMGTPTADIVDMMVRVGLKAKAAGIPVIFDPVAAGATRPRQEAARRILREVKPDVIKGNAAEINFLAGEASRQRGVDSLETASVAGAAARLAADHGLVVVATGVTDVVSDGRTTVEITGGHPWMGRITGTGCMSASVQGAFAAVNSNRLAGAVQAVLAMNRAGELAHSRLQADEGTGHYRTRLIDAVSLLQSADLDPTGRVADAAV